jgi:hypothetical protein
MKSRIVLVVYKPFPGKEKELEKVVSKHFDLLRGQNLVTDRRPIVMRAESGSIIEIFEWLSAEAIASAHSNPDVLKLWDEFSLVCEYDRPVNVKELTNLFSEFEPISFN